MKFKLSDIVELTMGQSPKSKFYNNEGNGYPFLQGNRTFGFKKPTFDTYTTMLTKKADAGDVIMSVRAPVGDLNITPVDLCLGRGVCSLKMKNGNQEFLYYMMKYYVPTLVNKENGTVFGSVSRNDINNLEVDISSDSLIQKKIARILCMIDDKIELNNKINNNLEQQAIELVKEYIKSTSQRIALSSITSFANGFAFQSSSYQQQGKYKIITIKNVQDGSINSQGAAYINDISSRMKSECFLNIGDVLLSLTGNVGRVGIVFESDLLLNQRVAKFIPIECEILPYLYFFFRLPSTKISLEIIAKGTAQQNLSPVETLKLEVPFDVKIKILSDTLIPIFKCIVENQIQNKRLAELRDILLPKLVSGELDITEVDF